MSETQLTAYDWLTSDKPAAVQWRKAADITAFNRVYDQAAKEGKGQHLTIPPTPLTRPPTKISKHFQIPEAAPPAHAGTFFTIPGSE